MTRDDFRNNIKILSNRVDSANEKVNSFDFALDFTIRKEFDSMSFYVKDAINNESDFLYYKTCHNTSDDAEEVLESCFKEIENFLEEDRKTYKAM